MSGYSNDVGCDRTSAQSSITSPLWHVSVRTAPATSSGAASHCGKKDLGWLSQTRKTVRAPARKNTTSAHLSKSSLTCGPSSDRHWPEGNSALRIRITALITAGKSARAGEHPNPKGFGKGSTKSAGPEDGHPTPQGSDPPRVTGQRSTPRRDPASNWNQRPLSLAGLARLSRVKTIKNIDCGLRRPIAKSSMPERCFSTRFVSS